MTKSGPLETAIQNAYAEADPLASLPRGLVLFTVSERPHPDSPPPQSILEIYLQGSGISVHSPSFWTIPHSPHFYEVHGYALSPLRQKGIRILNYLNTWLILAQSEDELLSHRSFLLSHLDCLGLRVNFAKSVAVPQPMDIISGNSSRLDPNEGNSRAKMCTGYSAARGLI
ncbi:Granule associated Rac and RHOG effector protein 1 [Labeo rohita]|uniref:Granule associated Rac and RHOG effector protein 1 n=1 Tax=Labeo rohita TaxID=84645 RepID=A0ABQ8L9Q5_LABRO|nr:Granule associated Rac and RHOG effector protein 1 [Labeo rohita]